MRFITLGFFFVLAVTVALAVVQDEPGDSAKPYTMAARVEMVALDLTVVDRRGSFVSGLTEGDFRVLEDGVPQQIKLFSHEDVPVTIGLVVDNSGSMLEKRSYVIGAALAFAQSSNRDDELFVVHFNDDLDFGLGPGVDFTSDVGQLRKALLRLTCEGRTALYDALTAGLLHISRGRYQKKALLVVSDGQDNVSGTGFEEALELARHSGVVIYTIGAYNPVTDRHNTKVLKKLADVTGGQFYFPSGLPQIISHCRRIAKGMRTSYRVGYYSTNTRRDGAYRHVVVTAGPPARGKLAVKVREGYYAPPPDGSGN